MTPERDPSLPAGPENEQQQLVDLIVDFVLYGEPEETEETTTLSSLELISNAFRDSDQPRATLELARQAWQESPDRAQGSDKEDKDMSRREVLRWQIVSRAMYAVENGRQQLPYDLSKDFDPEKA